MEVQKNLDDGSELQHVVENIPALYISLKLFYLQPEQIKLHITTMETSVDTARKRIICIL